MIDRSLVLLATFLLGISFGCQLATTFDGHPGLYSTPALISFSISMGMFWGLRLSK